MTYHSKTYIKIASGPTRQTFFFYISCSPFLRICCSFFHSSLVLLWLLWHSFHHCTFTVIIAVFWWCLQQPAAASATRDHGNTFIAEPSHIHIAVFRSSTTMRLHRFSLLVLTGRQMSQIWLTQLTWCYAHYTWRELCRTRTFVNINIACVINQCINIFFTSFTVPFFWSVVVSFICLLFFSGFSDTVFITACSLQSSLSSDDAYNTTSSNGSSLPWQCDAQYFIGANSTHRHTVCLPE